MTMMSPPEIRGHLFIALLSYRPEINYHVMESIEACVGPLAMMGWRSQRILNLGSADLCDSRNILVSQFLAMPEYTHILLVDGDVSWEPGTVERMVSHPVDLVLGAYRKRADPEEFPVRMLSERVEFIDPATGTPHPKGICKIAGGPAGLMRISRACLQQMVSARPGRWYHQPKVSTKRAWDLFEFTVINNSRHSEDMNFCRQWREMGGDVWLDPHLKLHHHGDKTYSGCFADHLRQLGRTSEPGKVVRMPLGNNLAAVNSNS